MSSDSTDPMIKEVLSKNHQGHHRLIAERAEAFRSAKGHYYRRRASVPLSTTLSGHLKGEHGWKHDTGPPLSIPEMTTIHDWMHERTDP